MSRKFERTANPRTMNAVLSPGIMSLPAELLLEIFSSVQMAQPLYSVAGKPCTAPWSLGQVCRQWREIVWSTPRMWSYIRVDDQSARCKFSSEILHRALEASGTHSLRVFFGFSRTELALVRGLLSIALDHSDRWETVDLTIDPSCVSLLNTAAGKVDSLRNFTVEFHDSATRDPRSTLFIREDEMAPTQDTLIFCDGASKLDSIRISDDYSRFSIPFHLSSATLAYFSDLRSKIALGMLQQYLRILSECTGLKSFGVGFKDDDVPFETLDAITNREPIVSHLTSFQAGSARLIRCLVLPNLADFEVGRGDLGTGESYYTFPGLLEPIRDLLSRSKCPLKSISLNSVHLDDADTFVQLLQFVPSLESLDLTYFQCWGEQFDPAIRMLFQNMVASDLLPSLVSLSLDISTDPEDGEEMNFLDQSFVEMVSARTGPDFALKEVRVSLTLSGDQSVDILEEDVGVLRRLNESKHNFGIDIQVENHDGDFKHLVDGTGRFSK